MISIHAPRTGSDVRSVPSSLPLLNFNPRSPHGERRHRIPVPTRRRYFNPRSPHGERPGGAEDVESKAYISIHAPRTGSDRTEEVTQISRELFQSTLPARGATLAGLDDFTLCLISIHAPRTGSDTGAGCCSCRWRYFNPRSPHGERHGAPPRLLHIGVISIHAPRTGSDHSPQFKLFGMGISIHAPRTGSDVRAGFHVQQQYISIHAPRTGSDARP